MSKLADEDNWHTHLLISESVNLQINSMNWKNFWDRHAHDNAHPQAQVGRIKGGMTLSEQILDDIVQHIVEQTKLQSNDILLDLCCGNGLLTQKLAKRCKEVYAVDISPAQIELAKQQFSSPNIQYVAADVAEGGYLPKHVKCSKINLYFSFQYFDSFSMGKKAISNMLPYLDDGGSIFIGDVPAKKYLKRYYATPKARLKYFLQQLLGTNDMGKFWSAREMQRIADHLGMKLKVTEQPAKLPYASYRQDFLLKKG